MKTVLCLSFLALMVNAIQAAGAQSIPHHLALRPASEPLEATIATSTSGTGQDIGVVFHRADWTIDPRTQKRSQAALPLISKLKWPTCW